MKELPEDKILKERKRCREKYWRDREKNLLRQKEYRIKNREKIREYAKTQKFNCRCGSTCRLQTRKRHNKSLKHQQWFAHFILLTKNEGK